MTSGGNKMEKLTIRDSTLNIPIDVDSELATDFINLLKEDSVNSELRHNEIRNLLECILLELKHPRKKK